MLSSSDNHDINKIISEIKQLTQDGDQIVFISGNFNVIHPGHLRLIDFATECGDILVIGITDDDAPGVLISGQLRLDSLRAISSVNYVFLLPVAVEEFIAVLKPHIVVKGKEHEFSLNPEQSVIKSYGGKLIFSSGEVRFSSKDLLRRELHELNFYSIKKPFDFMNRYGFNIEYLVNLIQKFSFLEIVVIGDLIIDEYITCEPLGMSHEDPTIVVAPITHDQFVGGAGVVASHAKGLGAKVKLFSIVGNDHTADFAEQMLANYGVDTFLFRDESRPTTLKKRYRSQNKTLLRVSHLRQHDISQELIAQLLCKIESVLENADLLVFSDFNYGCLPQALVDEIIALCKKFGVPMVADSQSSSQVGDISRYHEMLLITPTEYEARLAIRNSKSGLAVLANHLQIKARAEHVLITMGAEGVLIQTYDQVKNTYTTDQLPAFNHAPKDVSGAGDCLLVCTSMALVAGASIWASTYLGSIAAACQVGRVGNLPISIAEVIDELIL